MVAARDEQRDPLRLGGIADAPAHPEACRDLLAEAALEQLARAVEALEVELHPQEEAPALGIGRVLVGGDDVRAELAEQAGDRRDDAVPVRAGDEQARVIGERVGGAPSPVAEPQRLRVREEVDDLAASMRRWQSCQNSGSSRSA